MRWELPFALGLPPRPFLCWEPAEGTCAIELKPSVGALEWKRRCGFLSAKEVHSDVGQGEHARAFPQCDYMITGVDTSGREVPFAQVTGGPRGGFSEARSYSVAVVFLCLRHREEYPSAEVGARAEAARNNAIDVYRFLSMDPLSRRLAWAEDSYCTVVSVADVPSTWRELAARDVLLRRGELSFGCTIGRDRSHQLRVGSPDDLQLAGGCLPRDQLSGFEQMVTQEHELDLFHVLFLSAFRRLNRWEPALAVVDAQSGFEAAVASILRKALSDQGKTDAEADAQLSLGGDLHFLTPRLKELDKIAASLETAAGRQIRAFDGSPEEKDWRRKLYNLRHKVVHSGVRDIGFEDAKAAVAAGIRAVGVIQALTPLFSRKLIWSGKALSLDHIQQTAGRASRMFEY
ncbi:MAG TPA: hypothetical protein VNE39_05535 [Planctomycetota bacterium]|nr:hypothetical protein [Planctomycetota bacterium]